MIRKLRALGVTGLAVFAMSAMASSAGAADFTSATGFYPVAVTGNSTGDVFDAFEKTVKCTNNAFTGLLPGKSAELVISPSWNSCTAFGLPATVTAPAEALKFTSNGTVHVNKEIKIDVFASSSHTLANMVCQVHIKAQTPTGTGVSYTNNADGTVQVSGTIGAIHAQNTKISGLCPVAATTTTTANYTIQAGGIKVECKVNGVPITCHVK